MRLAVSLASWLALVCGATAGSGCVTLYDPQRALQRPVVLDTTRANFEGTRVRVRCLSNDGMSAGDAESLCRRVATLLRNQGAEVDTEVLRGPRYSAAQFDDKPDVILELDSKLVHKEESPVLVGLSVFTFTMIPIVEEETFEQGITLRDAGGAVLAQERPQARFITYTGGAIWAVNWLLDVFIREEPDKLTGDAANKAFSRDFYGLVSQLTFNARVRQRLLGDVANASAAPTFPAAPASSSALVPRSKPAAAPPPLAAPTPAPAPAAAPTTTTPAAPPTPPSAPLDPSDGP